MRRWNGSALVQVLAWRLATPSHYLNQCWLIVNWILGNKLQQSSNRNTKLFISFMKMHLQFLSAKWRPSCPGGDELTHHGLVTWPDMASDILINTGSDNEWLVACLVIEVLLSKCYFTSPFLSRKSENEIIHQLSRANYTRLTQTRQLVSEDSGLELPVHAEDCISYLSKPCNAVSLETLLTVLEIPTVRRSETDNFGEGLGTFYWFFFNVMFIIWDSKHEDLQLFWLSFKH